MLKSLLLLIMLLMISPVFAQETAELAPITPENANQLESIAVLGGGSITQPAWSPDGNTIAVAGTLGIWLYDANDLQAPPHLLEGYTREVTSLAFSPDGAYLVSNSLDRNTRLWDIATERSEIIITRGPYGDDHASVAFSPDGQLLATGDAGAIELYDVRENHAHMRLEHVCDSDVISVAFSPDGDLVACGTASFFGHTYDGGVGVWSFSEGELFKSDPFEGDWHPMGDAQVAFSSDGAFLFVCCGIESWHSESDLWQYPTAARIRAWDTSTREFVILPEWWHQVSIPVFSPARNQIAYWRDAEITILNFDTGEVAATNNVEGSIAGMAFSPSGDSLAYIEDNILYRWDFATQTFYSSPRRHSAGITHIAFSPDGAQLVSTSTDGGVELWDVNSGTRQEWEPDSRLGYSALAFNPDGTQLVAATNEGNLLLWGTPTGVLLGAEHSLSGVVYDLGFDEAENLIVLACGTVESSEDHSADFPEVEYVMPAKCVKSMEPSEPTEPSLLGDIFDVLTPRPPPYNPRIPAAFNLDLSAFALPTENGAYVTLYDTLSGAEIRHWGVTAHATAIAFDPTSEQIAVGLGRNAIGGTAQISLQILRPGVVRTLVSADESVCETELSRVNALVFSPNESLLTNGAS